jgi:hypothetical protein
MSESHGTCLSLKRHEDLEKVAAYVKQQVREKSIEQVGEDLSEDDKYVGLQINEDKNEIIWHDYGHHGNHLDFNPIAESVIKEFPEVEMERQCWYGQAVRNYVIVDGKWQQYILWKFVAYTDGKGEEVQLEYKQLKDGRTEEEKHEERDRMCKEMAERLSRLHPDVEMAVYAFDWYEDPTSVEEFYKVKGGHATKEMVDRGLVAIMGEGYFDAMEWVENLGHLLLYPMENAAEVIKRARNGEDYCPQIATEMLLRGDTAKYFSLIEPADKEWLMKLVEEREDTCAIYCLLHGMHHKYKYWIEKFVDEDTNMEVELLRYEIVEGSTFEKSEGEEERLIQMVMEQKDHIIVEELTKLCFEIDDNQELLLERIEKGDEEAAIFIDDPAILQELCDKGNKWAAWELYFKNRYGDEEHGIFIHHKEARLYYDLALKLGYELDEEGNDAWDDTDDPGEEYPSTYQYELTGNVETLNGVETLINDLCQKFGTPDNELGLYVPQRQLMRVLVGSDTEYYRGNVITMDRESPDRLIITTEADKGEPLLYALRYSFENLNVEMK